MTGVLRIQPFESRYEAEVIDLIVGIQRDEFGVEIAAEDQPDLREIPSFYQRGAGNFWVALGGDEIVGTASLLDIGDCQAALRKMFVHRDHRMPHTDAALQLLRTLLAWAREKRVREIYLGTVPRYYAAHRFYEKNGFAEIPETELPVAFPIMEVDKKFYRMELASDTRTGEEE